MFCYHLWWINIFTHARYHIISLAEVFMIRTDGTDCIGRRRWTMSPALPPHRDRREDQSTARGTCTAARPAVQAPRTTSPWAAASSPAARRRPCRPRRAARWGSRTGRRCRWSWCLPAVQRTSSEFPTPASRNRDAPDRTSTWTVPQAPLYTARIRPILNEMPSYRERQPETYRRP